MKSGFLEKLIGRLGRIGPEEVQNYLLRLAQEKGFLETIFNSIQEGIIVTDATGRITYVNDAACELFGLDSENAIGKRLDERVRGLDWKALSRSKGCTPCLNDAASELFRLEGENAIQPGPITGSSCT